MKARSTMNATPSSTFHDTRGLRALALARLGESERIAAQTLIGRLLDAAPAAFPQASSQGETQGLLDDLRFAAGWAQARRTSRRRRGDGQENAGPDLPAVYGEVEGLLRQACQRLEQALEALPEPAGKEADEEAHGEALQQRSDALLHGAGDRHHLCRHAARVELPGEIFEGLAQMVDGSLSALSQTTPDAFLGAQNVPVRPHIEALVADLRATQYSLALPIVFADPEERSPEELNLLAGLLPFGERLDRLALDLTAYLASIPETPEADPAAEATADRARPIAA